MLTGQIARHYSEARLRKLLFGLFVLLALPAGFLIWQGFDQLKWESWYQQRNQAETLASVIDANLSASDRRSSLQGVDNYNFLESTGVQGVFERSPLSTYPVPDEPHGLIGHFQVSPTGEFSSPLVPADNDLGNLSGIDEEELAARRVIAASIRSILADNALVQESSGGRVSLSDADAGAEIVEGVSGPLTFDERDANEESPAEDLASNTYDAGAFERLNAPVAMRSAAPEPSLFESSDENELGKVSAIQLDDALEQRNIAMQQVAVEREEGKEEFADANTRRRQVAESPAVFSGVDSATSDPITTFESAVEPFQFSLLAGGHGVYYRNAWRDGNRYIQGFLVDQRQLIGDAIETPFRESSLAGMSDLVVGFRDDVITVVRGSEYNATRAIAGELAGTLLYRQRLSAPLDDIELVFSVNRLPPGPGAAVLTWTSVAIGVVMTVGFLALYRLGVGQIRLARQQQDFVSSVSHELKTPLTSIRMYGEMLKEGWVDEDKREQYYDFIHDESERLTRLIANVLQLARVNRDDLQLDPKSIEVATLLDQFTSKVSHACERAGFDLQIDATGIDGHEQIAVDEDAFAQILINLVDNGIKFSRDADRKEIHVAAKSDSDNRISVSVRDFGPGIAKDQLRKIFELFYRSESELTRETVGTGIGLAIVKQLTESMGGDVDVANRGPGAEFILKFPLAEATID